MTPVRPRRRVRNRIRLERSVSAPERFFTVDEAARGQLLLFLNRVEQYLSQGVGVRIRFDNVKELHPCGTLVFMARLDCWLATYPGKLSCNYPMDEVVEELFQHVNVLQRLGLKPRKEVVRHDKVAHWHYHCGSNADPSGFRDLTAQVISQIDHPNGPLFGDCLNEAITNTVGHAYENFNGSKLPTELRKWWIFSQYKDERFFVAIYDVGQGIPTSLRRKPEWTEYLRVRQYNDAYAIQSAIESNRTRTNQPERGQGLPEMLEFSKGLQAGGLMIMSARGGFEYKPVTGQSKRRNFHAKLPGTLVQWAIPFRKGQNDGNHEHIDS